MKKALLFLGMLSSVAYAQDCSEIIISEYVEGSGNDKAIELYNPTGTAINLSGYKISRFSNGQATSNAGGNTSLTGTIAPYSTFVIVNGQMTTQPNSPACSPALQLLADQLDGAYPAPTYMNGNDAIALYKNNVLIDLMGRIGDAAMLTAYGWSDQFPYDGSAGKIWTENHTLIRKSSVKKGVSVSPDPFIVTQQWDSLPKDTWSNLGTHTCDCFLGLNENTQDVEFSVYPNPSMDGLVYIKAQQNAVKIEILDLTGKVINSKDVTTNSSVSMIETNDVSKGTYFIRVYFDNNAVGQQKFVIK